MCSGSKRRTDPTGFVMESEFERQDGLCLKFSILLELAASDDLIGFRNAIEEEGCDIDEASFWYGRKIGSKKMGFELRTPLMIAAMFGSKNVLAYIVETGFVDLNRASGSDKATALHLAASGGALLAPEVVRILLDGFEDVESVDANENRPGDLIARFPSSASDPRMKILEVMLKGRNGFDEKSLTPRGRKDVEKKEYPVDLSLPDIKNGVYGTDEFRMYMFKIKPCSRAYSHDWTECPFVHPGENARRRDPRKYHYSCVPCPEFRKGACRQGDACEYAHGIFECWLHPAQYRTRLCKDETGCARRVCFFAHKTEELRPLYASTGSAVPSPKSLEMGSSPMSLPAVSTPPMTPTGLSSPTSANIWQSQCNIAPPTLQLPGSRLRSAFSARDGDLDMELLGMLSPSSWNNPFSAASFKPTNLENLFGSPQSKLSSIDAMQSPNGTFLRHTTIQQLRNGPSSPARKNAFANRSQSFIDRTAVNRHSGLSGWSSPDGKLDWGVQGDELNKLKKSASFGIRSNGSNYSAASATPSNPADLDEPDVSWVQTLVKDVPSENPGKFGYDGEEKKLYHTNNGGSEAWMEQVYIDKEQMVA